MNLSNEIFWWRLELELLSELEESFVWKLGDLGIYRFAIEYHPESPSKRTLFVWLVGNEWSELQRENLINCFVPLVNVFKLNLPNPIWQKISDEDWTQSWKIHWKPDPVGDSLLILPSWLEAPEEYLQRKVIHLDPGSAFGTGSHPSTRLCLKALEAMPLKGLRVADLGCGSGILSIASLCLGAKHVTAVDIDSLAVNATRENAQINQFNSEKIEVFLGSVDTLINNLEAKTVDVLVCNILAPIIKELAPSFDQLIAPMGRALLSGLLISQSMELQNYLISLGWTVYVLEDQGPWRLLEISMD